MKQVSDVAEEEFALGALRELTMGELRAMETEGALRVWLRDHRTESDLDDLRHEYWEARRDAEYTRGYDG